MLTHNFDWPLLALCLFGSMAVGLLIFHGAAAFYHLRYYVRRRDEPETWKCQPKRYLKPGQNREAALLSSFNISLGGFISGSFIYAITQGMPVLIYYDVADYGWPYTIASGLAMFLLNEAGAYYIHRGLHNKFMFRHIHRHHHKYIATSPYVTTALHPLELVALQASTYAPIFLFPLHAGVIGAVLIYILIFNINDHSGVKLTSILPWQGPSSYHDDHHRHFHCNFGQHLMFFDRLHGTLRRVDRSYGVEVFGGKGKMGKSAGSQQDPFVAY